MAADLQRCMGCGSPDVVAMEQTVDGSVAGYCARCRATHLGFQDGAAHAALALIGAAVGRALERGLAHPDDISEEVRRAIDEWRPSIERRRIPTLADVAEAEGQLDRMDRGRS